MAINCRLSRYNIGKKEKVLVDTNVLLTVFEIQESRFDTQNYTDLFFKLAKQNKLYVNSHIISEFINTGLRNAYKQYMKKEAVDITYKGNRNADGYRDTDDFQKNYDILIQSVQEEIFPNTTLVSVTNEDVLLSVSNPNLPNQLDYNDEIIIKCAARNNFSILTQDHDYLNCKESIHILHL